MIDAKTSIMVYGRSDAGKSTQARYVAEYVWKKYKKKTRLLALDRGSLWSPCADLVDEGIVIPLEVPTDPSYNPFAIGRKLARGEWPEGGVINQPTAVPTKMGSVEVIRYKTNTKWNPWTAKDTEEIGALVLDSFTSYATAFIQDAKTKNVRIGQEAIGEARNEEGEVIGSNTEGHYGDVHAEVLSLLQSFQVLPPLISLFTALEGAGEEKREGIKRPTLGPQTVGKANNSVLPSRVQNCFHMVAEGAGPQKKVKAWYSYHPSELPKLDWPGKVALLPHEVPEFWKKYPQGYIPLSLEKGIAEFLEFRDSLREGKGGK